MVWDACAPGLDVVSRFSAPLRTPASGFPKTTGGRIHRFDLGPLKVSRDSRGVPVAPVRPSRDCLSRPSASYENPRLLPRYRVPEPSTPARGRAERAEARRRCLSIGPVLGQSIQRNPGRNLCLRDGASTWAAVKLRSVVAGRNLVPPARCCSAWRVCSGSGVQVCCNLRPAMGFIAFSNRSRDVAIPFCSGGFRSPLAFLVRPDCSGDPGS